MESKSTIAMRHAQRPRGREAIKSWNRQKIIDATVEVIIRNGITGTTIARVVELANVSMGLVNRQFTSKEVLLDEVLSHLCVENQQRWKAALENAPENPALRIRAIIEKQFDPTVRDVKTMAVLFAFRAHTQIKPDYVEKVSTRQQVLLSELTELFKRLNQKSGFSHPPAPISRGVLAMLEGMWTDYFLYPDNFDVSKAVHSMLFFLNGLYPGQFRN
jgi:TetR/AcrR family transcriptional regulator, transcriptional repressor of bet genes